MKRLIICIIFLGLLSPLAALGVGEPPLSEANKAEIRQALSDILKNKQITEEQYAQAIAWVDASPCNGVDRRLIEKTKPRLAAAVAKQLRVKAVDVLKSFKYTGWTIIYVDTHDSDEPYLFYFGDPMKAKHPATVWSGAATILEATEIEQWVLANAPGIPKKLARCFAWHVTLSRD